ncbi:MAG: virulence factor family protein, partial [Pseudomonas sp. PGPPP3]
MLSLLALSTLGAIWAWCNHAQSAGTQHLNNSALGTFSLTKPGKATKAQVILALPAEQLLSDTQLLSLSQGSGARIVQYSIAVSDCDQQQHRLHAAQQQLDGPATLVAGIGPGAALAWRWLATQDDEQHQAISVGFSLEHPDCPAPLPPKSEHGQWLAAWNNNPDDPSARFVRGQPHNTQNLISDYDTSLQQLLYDQLSRRLQGLRDPLPVIELPASSHNDTVTLFYSGDGGWRDLDMEVAEDMAKHGYPVVGI